MVHIIMRLDEKLNDFCRTFLNFIKRTIIFLNKHVRTERGNSVVTTEIRKNNKKKITPPPPPANKMYILYIDVSVVARKKRRKKNILRSKNNNLLIGFVIYVRNIPNEGIQFSIYLVYF